jgi:D-alanyl-lipoteichoic acid acyltransferase DltB (MBOAT superfamily)
LGRKQFGIAIFWILNGLVKKVVISDYIATNFVDRVFSNPTMYSGFENLFALFAYSLQLYADFSGYTDIAIGAAMIMGFYLPANFNSPYKALNPSDFWKRWHMTLSSWLKDYLYIPLGGNRSASWASYSVAIFICIITIILLGNIWIALIMFALVAISIFLMKTKLKLVTNIKQKIQQKIPTTIKQKLLITNSIKQKIDTNINLMNTMLIGGLWHGASWNFMIWGGLNGFGILLHRFWKNFSGDLYLSIFSGFTAILLIISSITNIPILNIAAVWSSIFCVQFIVLAYYIPEGKVKKYAERAFSIMQTFVFISFTRLFFRSGSGMNIDPTQASSIAWETTKSMISQIGSSWNFPQIAEIIYQFKYLFLLIVVGMVIHWLPTNFKRRYRLIFAKLPVPVICILVVVTIFVIYQFATADLQSFIYFQF